MQRIKIGYIDYPDLRDEEEVAQFIQQAVWEPGVILEMSDDIKKEFIEYVMKSANAGNERVMNQLGAMYMEGIIVEKDMKKGFLWYSKAAEWGNMLATSNLGFCYLYGRGTEVNEEEAFRHFAKAAIWGYGDAYVRLGDMYQYGKYVERDQKTALKLYYDAFHIAEKDLEDWGNQQVYSDVCRRIGECFFYGNGVKEDLIKALEFCTKAVEFYSAREKKGDAYSAEGFAKTKEMIAGILSEI